MAEAKTKTIYQALLAAQQDMGPVLKNATNPAFRSRYADLGSVIETISEPLHKNGLVYTQVFATNPNTNETMLQTRLIYIETGEVIVSETRLRCKDPNDPQKVGGAITYFRRYSLLSLLGLAPEDDDGNSASQSSQRPSSSSQSKPVVNKQTGEVIGDSPETTEPG